MNTSNPVATKEKLFEEFNTVVAETETLLKTVATAGGEQAGALKERIAHGLADAEARLARMRADAVQQASAAARATDHYVHAHPWNAVGLAAVLAGAAGLVAGLLIARR